MGEYARALAIALAVKQRRPECDIHFALSRQAPYAADTPFPKTLLPSSPTFHTPEVARLIRDFRPSLVFFDNAGRTAQLRAAVRAGARVVFVSSRPRQRRKAFRLRWMRMIDEHWIAYPEFIAAAPGPLERLKLRYLTRPRLRYLDTVLPPEDPLSAAALMRQYDLRADAYVLVVPGGGSDHPGAERAPQIVAEAARRIAARGIATILVGVSSAVVDAGLRLAPRMPMASLAALIRGARLVVSNGGDTLLQAIACARPCVAVAIAADQPHRIDKCVQAGLAVRAGLDAQDLERQVLALWEEGPRRERLMDKLASAGIRNGMDTAVRAIEGLATSG